ncbi:MAG TPA: hypothetical protein VGU73_04810 [Acidimicrobiia bacterium]|nr:hypothetical protein [Acidimicrobiia bacterium]
MTAQWVSHVADAYRRGMVHADTLWYHGPYAAQFVQTGRLTGLLDRSDTVHTFGAMNSELVHALLILPFHRDVLSPLVNLGWAALAMLAAWCIGRRHGVGPLAVLGVAVVLGLPTVAGTHPGQASNDVMAGSLVLTCVALLLESDLQPLPVALAALSGGLALGTKLTIALPVAFLAVSVLILALRQRRRATAAWWSLLLALSGCYWFARNISLVHNPVPWFRLSVGPIHLTRVASSGGATIAGRLTDSHAWSSFIVSGLHTALGPAWPVVVAVPIVGAAVVVYVRRDARLEQIAGATVLVASLGYLITPGTAHAGGLSFVFNLRYLAPALLLGYAVWPSALTRSTHQAWAAGALLALVVIDATAPDYERVPAWPTSSLVFGAIAGVLVLLVVFRPHVPPLSVPARASLVAALVAVVFAAGWLLQRSYLEHRYLQAGLNGDEINSVFRSIRGARVGVDGTIEVYPYYGLDLSNHVATVEAIAGAHASACETWQALVSEHYEYVVTTRFGFALVNRLPPSWFVAPVATLVRRSGQTELHRLHGLVPAVCSPAPEVGHSAP